MPCFLLLLLPYGWVLGGTAIVVGVAAAAAADEREGEEEEEDGGRPCSTCHAAPVRTCSAPRYTALDTSNLISSKRAGKAEARS